MTLPFSEFMFLSEFAEERRVWVRGLQAWKDLAVPRLTPRLPRSRNRGWRAGENED